MVFKYHTSCGVCGSRDNLAMYSDGGGYCFGCGHRVRPSTSPYLSTEINSDTIVLPDDASFNYSQQALEWVGKYGLSTIELIKHKVYWSEQRQQLIFTWWDETGLLLWQARNFSPNAKSKCFTKGKPGDVLPIYSSKAGNRCLVIVEDPISAIKTARSVDCMPALGSDVPKDKIMRLSRFYGQIAVWLDSDMYDKAQRIARRFQLLGVEAKAIYTEKDPKEYSDNEINRLTAFD